MEISGPLSPGYAPPQVPDPITPSVAQQVARSAVAERVAITRDTLSHNRDRATLTRQETIHATDVGSSVENEQKALAPEQAQNTQSAAAGGNIQFEIEDRTQLMKVLDSKEVLIYQVPSKGALTLIKSEDKASAQQLLASA